MESHIDSTQTVPIGSALGALCCAVVLAGCADFNAMLAEPNSRTMTLTTLDHSVKPGMSSEEVLARIGRPAYRFPVGGSQSVWNYRFAPPEGDCVVFQVSFADVPARVVEIGQGYDRYCDGPNSHD